jgi:hypothetical protein
MDCSFESNESRSFIYSYYESKFYEFIPYYLNNFSIWANKYNLNYNKLDIIIDESNWKDDVHVILNNHEFQIRFPKGLFERLIYFISLVILKPITTDKVIIDAFGDYWKNPDGSIYDYIKLPHIDFSLSYLGPLLYDYDDDQEKYEKEFNKYFSQYYNNDILSHHYYIPFFWVIDFILYHEMSHILLRHFEYYDKFKKDNLITETKLDLNEISFQRHLIELIADTQSSFMLIHSLPKFKEAIDGKPIDEIMIQNFFNLAYLLQILFIYWAKTHTSIRMHKNFSHPHPDVRKIIVMNCISKCFDDIHRHEWEEQFVTAMVAIPNILESIGAGSLGDTIINPFCVYKDELREWQQKSWDIILNYQQCLNECISYVNDFNLEFFKNKFFPFGMDSYSVFKDVKEIQIYITSPAGCIKSDFEKKI